MYIYPVTWLWLILYNEVQAELYSVLKVSDSISITKLIPVLVSERQINDTFNNTFQNDINKHKAIFTQTWNYF